MYAPGINCDVSTLIVTWPVFPAVTTPPDGAAPSQADPRMLTVVCQYSEPPPLLVMVTNWQGGFSEPCRLLKLRLDAEVPSMGTERAGELWITSCTVTICVLCPTENTIVLE